MSSHRPCLEVAEVSDAQRRLDEREGAVGLDVPQVHQADHRRAALAVKRALHTGLPAEQELACPEIPTVKNVATKSFRCAACGPLHCVWPTSAQEAAASEPVAMCIKRCTRTTACRVQEHPARPPDWATARSGGGRLRVRPRRRPDRPSGCGVVVLQVVPGGPPGVSEHRVLVQVSNLEQSTCITCGAGTEPNVLECGDGVQTVKPPPQGRWKLQRIAAGRVRGQSRVAGWPVKEPLK